jgi:nuclear pore complex protein Nup98-Nup96
MSFGFGGNNQQQSTFGGFGSSNTGGGFGSNTNASTGGSLFGGNTATSGGFGGFGPNTNNSSPFGGNKTAFGASNTTSTGGGLFGGNTATSGGFGSSGGGFGTTTNTGGGFGGNTSGGMLQPPNAIESKSNSDTLPGLFGQNKPATPSFGASNTGGSLFGGGNTSGGFGATNTTSNPFSTNTNTATNTGFGASNTGGGFTFGGASSGAANNNNSGTANTPFQAFSEKDGGPTGATSVYQSVTFQQPYANKSFEELRTEDYAQGRRFGNTNGQAGGFGQSTGFGNFGSTTSSAGGLFGSNTATAGSTGFGASTSGGFGATNTGGFGSNTSTGGGLFGAQQSKPASTALFGTTNTNTSTGGFGANTNTNTGGGPFGSGGGFGANTQSNTGGSLFGNNNQQPKPAFGGFGSTTNNNTTGGFGSNTNTGGSLFGGNANTNTGGSLFGQNNQQQQQSNPFGAPANTGGSLFGNQNKPATGGLFGGGTNTSNTGGGLFGAQNNQQQSNPFGAATNTGGSLFGNQNQNKPPGTGLFGSSTNTNTGGGLFGAQNNQQGGSSLFGNNANTGSSLFGNQNKPAGNSLFGNNTNNNTSGLSLFGNNQNQQQNNAGSSLFGGGLGQNNQNQQNANTNSLFGGSFNQNNQQGTPQNQLHATLTGAPYGNEQLFSSLGAPSPPVGPLATPLSGGRPAPRKTPSLLASARLNTPVYSPRGGSIGRNGGYGFSYSTYGTPGSAFTSGSLTPGASSLLRPTGSLSSALTSRLNKSLSTSNLRGDGAAGDGRSLLRPSAFSPEGTPSFGGSVRKLKIDRNLRTDLFGPNSKAIEATKEAEAPGLRKRVSFEKTGGESTAEPTASNALVRTEEPEEDDAPSGLLREGPSRSKPPEMEQINGPGGPLTTVPEDTEVPRPQSAPGIKATEKTTKMNEVGDYWTKPAMKDLKHMSRQQLKNVGNFVVGREGVGRIEFGSVDLTNTPLEDVCGNIVQLNPRSATVYQEDGDKPAVGKALNVPSTIFLENSWPRSHGGKKPVHAKSGREYDKHIARLKRVSGTHFLSYNSDTGVWSFKVDHFTTYGLEDDDDDASEFYDDSHMHESSVLSDPPQTPTEQHDETFQSVETGTGEMEDTFQFKLDRRSQLSNIPGGFDSEGVTYDYDDPSADEGMEEDDHMMSGGLGDDVAEEEVDEQDPFVDEGDRSWPSPVAPTERMKQAKRNMLVSLASLQAEQEQAEEATAEELEEQIPGSFTAEPKMPRSILKPSALSAFDSPEKIATEPWDEQLQRTRSPKKRDRQALREMQKSLLRAREEDVIESPFKKSMLGIRHGGLDESYLAQRSAKKAKLDSATDSTSKKDLGASRNFRTHMDIMHSIYAPETKGRKIAAGGKGFEV